LAFASFYFGIAVQVFGVGCVMNFAPVIAMRQMAATPLMVGNTFGAATLAATILGFLIAQVGYRKLQPSIGPRLPALCLLGSAAFSGMVAAALLLAETPMQLFFGVGCFLTIVMAGTMLFPLALQDLTPAPIRGRMVSISVTFNIVLVGAVSDRLKDQANGLMIAVVCVSCLAMIVSTLLLLPLQRQYLRTEEAARKAEIDAS
jgi:MFS family permease